MEFGMGTTLRNIQMDLLTAAISIWDEGVVMALTQVVATCTVALLPMIRCMVPVNIHTLAAMCTTAIFETVSAMVRVPTCGLAATKFTEALFQVARELAQR